MNHYYTTQLTISRLIFSPVFSLKILVENELNKLYFFILFRWNVSKFNKIFSFLWSEQIKRGSLVLGITRTHLGSIWYHSYILRWPQIFDPVQIKNPLCTYSKQFGHVQNHFGHIDKALKIQRLPSQDGAA